MSGQTVLKVFNSRFEAEIVRSMLESYNIRCLITGDDEGGMVPYPFSLTSKGISIFVYDKDLKKAKELLKE